MIRLSERVYYIKAVEEPLSADVGVVFGDRAAWLYDVGNSPAVSAELKGIGLPKIAVLSHFHPDHTGGLGDIAAEKVYLSAYTRKYIGFGDTVVEDVYINDGIELRIFPLPSSHSKGALGLETQGFAFLGDGIYSMQKGGRNVYNATLLKDTLDCLKRLGAKTFLLSHDPQYACPRDEVIAWLEEICSRRRKEEAYIEIKE